MDKRFRTRYALIAFVASTAGACAVHFIVQPEKELDESIERLTRKKPEQKQIVIVKQPQHAEDLKKD